MMNETKRYQLTNYNGKWLSIYFDNFHNSFIVFQSPNNVPDADNVGEIGHRFTSYNGWSTIEYAFLEMDTIEQVIDNIISNSLEGAIACNEHYERGYNDGQENVIKAITSVINNLIIALKYNGMNEDKCDSYLYDTIINSVLSTLTKHDK